MNREELLYAKTHEWAHIVEEEGQKIATIGISDFAVQQLTDLVFMELPSVGDSLTAGESCGEIESVKAVSDVYSPVTGQVIAVNDTLPDNLERLNDDPYNKGWIAKVKVSDEAPLENLMPFAEYQQQCSADADH